MAKSKEVGRVSRGTRVFGERTRSFDWYVEKFPKQFKVLSDVDEYFEVIEDLMRKSAISWIKIGIYLEDARKRLGRKSYDELCHSLGLNPKATAWRYRKMAKHPWLSNPKNWPHLPASQAALLMIAKHEKELTPKKLDKLVEEEELHPAVELKDVKAWLPPKQVNGSDNPEVYKPISKPIVMKFGGVPEGIEVSEKEWKELDKLIKKAYSEWVKKVTGSVKGA